MSEEAGPDPKRSRRLSGEPALDENIQFPELTKFNPPDKLPTIASVIDRLRYLMGGGKKNMEKERAVPTNALMTCISSGQEGTAGWSW